MSFISSNYERFRGYFSCRAPKLYNFCYARKSIIKFIFAGCFSGGADLVFLFILYGLLKFGLVWSTSIAFLLAFFISFTLQKFWTFRNYCQDKIVHQLSLYMLNAFIGLNLNGFFMHMLVAKYRIWYILAQVIVNLALAAWNFCVYKFIVFNIGKDATHSK
jgi:putative flippase GtrA